MDVQIRESKNADRSNITQVVLEAFGPEEGDVINTLVTDLLADPTAEPLVSLVALINDQVVGHVLFTKVEIEGAQSPVSATILAPLAVRPAHQNQGIGGRLISTGLQHLKTTGTDLVFVLGYPTYYSRHGFVPAGCLGFEATYPIPSEHADAWMVQELQPNMIGQVQGKVQCADALDDPTHW